MRKSIRHALPLLAIGCFAASAFPAHAEEAGRSYAPVTDQMIANPPAEEWLSWRRTFDNQGFSPLDKINRDTVGELNLAWAWPMADDGIQETAPLMHDGILFLQTNNNIVQALDARTGDLIWEYRPALTRIPAEWAYQPYQARRQKNSIALYEDAVVLTTVDARIIVIDARTGMVQRETQVLDTTKGYSYTVGPLVVDGKIISAISGCSIPGTAGGCYIMAHDFRTLEELWRVNTLEDPANPEVDRSWGEVPLGQRWGGTPWATGSYDPRTRMTFWGTGSPGPYTELIRGSGDGDVLYTNATLAIDVDTGKIRWYYQHLPRDNWDLDSPFERVLVDVEDNGAVHHLLVSVAGKNGIFFALDRDSGRYLWSQETILQNIVSRIDADGTVHLNEDMIPTAVGHEVHICPSISGGKLWQAGAYSPQTGQFYVPLTEACNSVSPTQTKFNAGGSVGSIKFGPRVMPEGVTDAGLIEAIKVGPRKRESEGWKVRQRTVPTSSLLATAGGLVIGGDAGRYAKAWDQETGDILWQQRLNAPVGGSPMTYELDGEQYLVIPTGYSSSAGSIASAFPETPLPSGTGNSIFVFKLPKR